MENLATLTLEGYQIGKKQPLFPKQQLNLPHDWQQNETVITLGQLIQLIVQEQVDAFEQRQQDQQLFRVLTTTQIEAGKMNGRIDPAAKKYRQSITVESAITIALQAFEDGLYYVFIDGKQIETIDEPITLSTTSTLKFIRLVALAGG